MAKILVVDDHRENRLFLKKLLGYVGHEVVEASDGAEALAAVRAERPDLVISDILMPRMDGFEFVRQLSSNPETAQTRVIFFTATYQVSQVEGLARELGVNQVLGKPARPEEILRVVGEMLGSSAPTPPLTRLESGQFYPEHTRLLVGKLSEKLDAAGMKLATMIDFQLDLSMQLETRRLLEHFCRIARELVGARCALVSVTRNSHPDAPHETAWHGLDQETAERLAAIFSEHDFFKRVAFERRTTRLADLHALLPGLMPAEFPVPTPLLVAAVISPGKSYGWVCLLGKIGDDPFGEDDERLIGIQSALVGRIYENGSLYREVQARAAELEREVIHRKQAEESVRLAQERLREIVASSPAVLFMIAIQGNEIQGIRWISENLTEMLGYPVRAAYEAGWWIDHIHPDDRETTVSRTQTELSTKGRTIHEYRFRHQDGSYRWTRGDIRLVQDPTGRLIGGVGSWSDITEQKRGEEALQKAQERLNGLFNSSSDGMGYVALDGTLLDVNDSFCRLTGYRRIELVGKRTYQQLTPPEFHDMEAEKVREMLQTGHPQEYEKEYVRKNGTRLPVAITAFLVKDAKGNAVGLAAIIKDIAQRRLLEQQFRQAQKMEAVGRLAGGVAHDFNNLLTIINGYSEVLLAQTREGDPVRGGLEQIRKSGERAAALTRQLLAFSRKQVLVPVVLDLNSIISEMEKILRRLIGEDIDLRVTLAPQLWRVKADPGQVEQVLMNLVVNARDAMPQGGKLTIETRNLELDPEYVALHPYARIGRYAMLAVTDTGHGMDKATQARIFEPFFTTKPADKGTGLGLATVYGIVKQSEGHIEVYSEPGHGSSFKVYFPQSDRPGPLRKSDPQRTQPTNGSETILVVEDDAGVRTLTRLVLESRGYTVLEAASGGEAILRCEQHSGPIHLLLSDVVMPGMSGPQLAERLAMLRPGLKQLFLSGYTGEAVMHHGILSADKPFLQKPYKPDELARKVREVLDQ